MTGNKLLRRYTDLPALLHLLKTKRLTLLDPSFWDDKNDAFYLQTYKTKKQLAAVLAICLTESPETYHHWKVFAGSSSGICIRFNKKSLLKEIEQHVGVRHDAIVYKTLEELRGSPPSIDELPFLKRYAFRDEGEYRIIYTAKHASLKFRRLAFNLSSIVELVINPWMPKALVASVKETVRNIDGCEDLKIFQTNINESTEWKQIAQNSA